jgi:hypothetical protein
MRWLMGSQCNCFINGVIWSYCLLDVANIPPFCVSEIVVSEIIVNNLNCVLFMVPLCIKMYIIKVQFNIRPSWYSRLYLSLWADSIFKVSFVAVLILETQPYIQYKALILIVYINLYCLPNARHTRTLYIFLFIHTCDVVFLCQNIRESGTDV